MKDLGAEFVDLNETDTLGDLQGIFLFLRMRGWTKASIEFVVDRVWWE